MKKIIATLLVVILCALLFGACGWFGDDGPVIINYPTKTAAFYGAMNGESFWFKSTVTIQGYTYSFTQATNGTAVTTIEDHASNNYDIYHIFGGSYIHKLNLSEKSYNTLLTKDGQDFLFKGYSPDMFSKAAYAGSRSFNGEVYYCETFDISTSEDGAVSGYNNYYFDGDKLVAIEISEGNTITTVIQISDYSNTIPAEIYLSAPSDFKKGSLEMETDPIDYSDLWGDLP